jgi:TonB family protein
MRFPLLVALLAFVFGLASEGQIRPDKKLPPGCSSMRRIRGSVPDGPFHWLPGESYKNSPIVKFQVNEDGTVSGARLIRSCRVSDIDKHVVAAVSHWKFKPRPGCGVIDTEMDLTIDWR